jgi:diguanylate cyclase (GGDEF)-like protein
MIARPTTPRLLVCAGLALLALHVITDTVGLGSAHADSLFAQWFQPAEFFGCGVAVLIRAPRTNPRAPWFLIGTGLVLYAGGNLYFNFAVDQGTTPGFPSAADALWLCLYPLSFTAIALLVGRRFTNVGAGVWLEGVICGAVAAALVAAFVFDPVFDVTVANGAASIARLAYPVGDLLGVGVVIVVWGIGGRRLDPFWALLGAGFALLAVGDSFYVVQAARGEWVPGNALDYPYALATMAIAAAAWTARPHERRVSAATESTRLVLPVACGLSALALAIAAVFVGINPLATALALLTLLAVVLRLGFTLRRVNSQSLELAALAAADPLTGLANHRTVHDRLDRELRRARALGWPLAVIALDIDHFKAINDTYGHTHGDAALQAIARVLEAQARGDEMVGRIGGEEFVLILPATSGADGYATAERCRAALAELSVQGASAGVACSAGVASYPDDADGATRLLELADGALYWAKRSGRAQTRRYDPNQVVLLSSAEQRAQVQAVLDAPDALTPVFQPIVEIATGRVAGYEALTRFLDVEPVRSPDVWFAQARRCGLGPRLEARAIEVALRAPDRPAGTFLSLNVSPAALLSPEVAAVLPATLDDIVIELTEDEVFSSGSAFDARLAELRERGARIAVDDAGAGYAGLQQLVRIKPEILKLDRSLITGVDQDESKAALLEALARFASTTGAAVCGEGIETLAELRMLARVDTTYAQGYALGRPGPPWPKVAEEMAAHTTADVSVGMRLARGSMGEDSAGGRLTLGRVGEALARVHSRDDLRAAVQDLKRLLHADDVSVSRVIAADRCVETLGLSDWEPADRRFSYDDYPTTEHVVTAQVLGQLIEGDPASDPAELEFLAKSGFSALLMAPIVFRGTTVGLLEVCRRTARPWTSDQIDQVRLLAHSLGAAMQADSMTPPDWSVETIADQVMPRIR